MKRIWQDPLGRRSLPQAALAECDRPVDVFGESYRSRGCGHVAELAACLAKIKEHGRIWYPGPHFSVLTDASSCLTICTTTSMLSGHPTREVEQVMKILAAMGHMDRGKNCVEYGLGLGA